MKVPVGEILFELPPKPKVIHGSDLKKKDQKWIRTEFPRNWESLSPEKQLDFVIEDIRRRRDGYWFMNFGEPVYLTGDHYFYLNWWSMDADTAEGFPFFKESDLEDFYFMEFCYKDPNCYGDMYLCNRRDGKTEKRLAVLYNRTTLNKKKHSGLQSLTSDDAKNNLFIDRVVRSWKSIPPSIRPLDDGTADPKSQLRFFDTQSKSIKNRAKKLRPSLNSWIDFGAAKADAYQGKKLFFCLLDEPGAVKEMDLLAWWRITKKCHTIGSKIIGKTSLPTTLENMEARGGMAYKELWLKSDYHNKDKNGRTQSGLYRRFKEAYKGLEGFIDEYGRDMRDENGEYLAKIFLQNERDSADPKDLPSLRRQFPFTIDEAFDISFDETWEEDVKEILKLTRNKIMSENLSPRIMKIVEYGEKIELVPSKSDPASLYVIEEVKDGVDYYIGVDSSGTDKRVGGETGSDYAFVVMKGLEGLDKENYMPVCHFSWRPNEMEQAYNILLLTTRYYGRYNRVKVLGEANVGAGAATISYFANRGCLKFMMKRPKNLGFNYRDKHDKYWIHRGQDVKDLQIQLGNQYLRKYGHNIKSGPLVDNLLSFGIQNADLADAFLMAVLAIGNFEKKEKEASLEQRFKWKRLIKRDSMGRTYQDWVRVPV